MNVLELYRGLPRSNCGRCPQRQCMAFAVALAKGEADPGQCPELSAEVRERLRGGSGQGDWREALIADLAKEVAALDFGAIAAGLGAKLQGGALAIRCLGRDFLVGPDGAVSGAAAVSPWMRILLLHYVRTRGSAAPAGPWVAFSQLKSGLVKASSFARECEDPLREHFCRDQAGAERALATLGAEREPATPAPTAWRILALPRVPLLILFWPPEEEFPAKLKVLFDATADTFLDVESLTFLVEGLAKILAHGPSSPPHD